MPQTQAMSLLTSQDSHDWYTPPAYLDAVRYTLGGIELDPASSPGANQNVKARRIYTIEDDGLAQPWQARSVFLNPPYGKTKNQSNQGLWAHKLIAEYQAGNIQEAILLVNLYAGYSWFEPLMNYPMCILDHLISFLKPDGSTAGKAKASSVFIYFGPNFKRFKAEFSQFGKVVKPIQWREETCLTCGDSFTPKAWGGHPRKYCGAACRQKAYRLRIAG